MKNKFSCAGGFAGRRQSGVVLFLGLMLLLMLTLLGAVYFQDAIVQGRLAGNFKDLGQAFEASEAGGRWGASWLQSRGGGALERPWPCALECDQSSPVWHIGQYPAEPQPSDGLWATANSYGIDPGSDEDLLMRVPLVHDQPRYIMEQQYFRRDDLAGDPQKGLAYYRVTARGIGQRSNSDAVLRSVVAKRFE